MGRKSPIDTTGLTPEQAKEAYKQYRKEYNLNHRLKTKRPARRYKNLSKMTPEELKAHKAEQVRKWQADYKARNPDAVSRSVIQKRQKYIEDRIDQGKEYIPMEERIVRAKAKPLTPEQKEAKRLTRIACYKRNAEAAGRVYIPKADRTAAKLAKEAEKVEARVKRKAAKVVKVKPTTKHKMAPIQRVGKPREKVMATRVNGDAGKVKTWSAVLKAHVMVGEGKTLAQIEEKYLGRRENQIGKW
jgi:bifunctional DNA-binding transcriptional regulator/antitoxin component of YhaV-PrlF toxin-antitoxin module